MAKSDWKPEYETNVGSVDAQHRRLFDLMRLLEEAIEQGRSHEAMGETMRGVVAYIKDHFAYEELLFKENAYSREAEHRKQHDALRQYCVQFLKDIHRDQGLSPVQLLNFLKTWWNHHILTHDFLYAQEFRDKGVSIDTDDLLDYLTKRSRTPGSRG